MALTEREKDEKHFEELKTLVVEQDKRLYDLQTSAFQLANYYFVFQGVILAAISHTATLNCSDRWFLFTLSLLAAVVNLSALCNMSVKYIKTITEYENTLLEINELFAKLENAIQSYPSDPIQSKNKPLNDPTQSFSSKPQEHPIQVQEETSNQQHTNQAQNQPRVDRYKLFIRCMYLGCCIVLFLGFAGVTLSGCWRILCEHNDCRHHHHHIDTCIKACDGLKCMKLCYDS